MDVVKTLLAHGADVNAKNESGKSPLLQAVQYGHKEVVEVLLQAGAEDARR
jgi:ankyrin repeat protein